MRVLSGCIAFRKKDEVVLLVKSEHIQSWPR
jgi:hypothetical protein